MSYHVYRCEIVATDPTVKDALGRATQKFDGPLVIDEYAHTKSYPLRFVGFVCDAVCDDHSCTSPVLFRCAGTQPVHQLQWLHLPGD